MSPKFLPRYFLVIAVLLCCGGCSEKQVAEKPVLPWNWEPEDPDLIIGKLVYKKTCSLCHNEGEEAAPMLSDKLEWETRKAKGEATLISHAIKGFHGDYGEMPMRGGNMHLSDEEVAAAVQFMLAAPKHH